MPGEWEPHERCLMAWPGEDLVSTRLTTAVKVDYGLVARAIKRFEPLLVLARPGWASEAAAYCGKGVEVLECPLEDAWLRDSGPLFARRPGGELVAVDFGFNGWGGPGALATAGAALAEHLGIEHLPVGLVLEGGAISVDGRGTLIAVAPTVLHANRNAGATREAFEAAFRELLGAERTIWLEHPLREDLTGGHADNVAAFVAPGRVACQTTSDRDDPNHAGLAANKAVLEAAGLEVVELDALPYRSWAGRRIALPYVNFYLGNGCAIVPVARIPDDARMLDRLRDALPGREIVGVPASNLWRRGGGPHCITQQQPVSGDR
jgi:agmatine deiminase